MAMLAKAGAVAADVMACLITGIKELSAAEEILAANKEKWWNDLPGPGEPGFRFSFIKEILYIKKMCCVYTVLIL